MPQYHILILRLIIPSNPRLNALRPSRLIRKLPRRKQLLIPILRNPDGLTCKHSPLPSQRFLRCEHHLARRCHELIRDWFVGDGVCNGVVPDFEDAVPRDVCFCCSRCAEGRLLGCIAYAVGVCFVVFWERDAVFVVDCVLVPVDGWVDSERKHVLVEGGHDSWPDIRSPGDSLAVLVVERDGGEDSCGADFQFHVCGLVEDVCEDVLVVGDGADDLEDELAVAHDSCGAGAVVGVFVLKAIVLFVHADYILHQHRVAFRIGSVAVEVFDVAEAVAA